MYLDNAAFNSVCFLVLMLIFASSTETTIKLYFELSFFFSSHFNPFDNSIFCVLNKLLTHKTSSLIVTRYLTVYKNKYREVNDEAEVLELDKE